MGKRSDGFQRPTPNKALTQRARRQVARTRVSAASNKQATSPTANARQPPHITNSPKQATQPRRKLPLRHPRRREKAMASIWHLAKPAGVFYGSLAFGNLVMQINSRGTDAILDDKTFANALLLKPLYPALTGHPALMLTISIPIVLFAVFCRQAHVRHHEHKHQRKPRRR